jgi:hypothetical protein
LSSWDNGSENSSTDDAANGDAESNVPLFRSSGHEINMSKLLHEEVASLRGIRRFLSLKELRGFSVYEVGFPSQLCRKQYLEYYRSLMETYSAILLQTRTSAIRLTAERSFTWNGYT